MRTNPAQATAILLLLLAAASAKAEQALYRCVAGTKLEFRQTPCDRQASSERQLNVHAPAVGTVSPPPTRLRPLPEHVPPPAAPPRSEAERLAEICLDWYRPKLRDPRGAYLRDPVLEKNIVRLTLHATNRFGGYVLRPAACEFKQGFIDEGWTRIQADRLGW